MKKRTDIIVKVGLGSCGIAAGAKDVYDLLKIQLADREGFFLEHTSCNGMCYREPIVEVFYPDGRNFLLGNVQKTKIPQIIAALDNRDSFSGKDIINYKHVEGDDYDYRYLQKKIVLENCGVINPDSIEEYLEKGGYSALKDIIFNRTSVDVIEEIKKSGLRGRGGAGFSTGMKWDLAQQNKRSKKFVICNADEGDPGAFMDRAIIEGDPHRVIEGLIISGYAIEAQKGYIYVRAEYPLAVKRLRIAIKQAEEKGFLGKNILGKNFSFEVVIKEGAGAFVCGEETALIASIEGKRGIPRIKPPYPAKSGLWGYPTNINNVETLANIPWIIRNSADEYLKYGSKKSRGTKVFALAGKVKRSGLVEVEMGLELDKVINMIGGGSSTDKPVKAVQLGGPSGGCLPVSLFDTPVDYESLQATGSIIGSGGMIVMDEETCMVDVARYFLSFIQLESCGKCTFCRIGTKRMLEILERITEGKGELVDLDNLTQLAAKIQQASLCQLGKTAPNPVLTTLRYFKDEYLEHIIEKKCRAGVCKALLLFSIKKEDCTGCTLCAKNCPTNAISGKPKGLHSIDQSKCIQCGLCYEVCRFGAVLKMAKGQK